MKTRTASLALIAILAWTSTIYAEDIYVSQAGAGLQDGSSVANARSLVWLNTSANWGVGVGNVSPGDVVRLSGTFGSRLTIRGSGSGGSPVRVFFEPGARFSAPRWSTGGPNVPGAAIEATGVSFITIDGNGGVIEATESGTARSFNDYSVGVLFYSSANITVQNLTVTNMYVRTPNSTDANAVGGGIHFRSGASDITVSNCVVAHMNAGIYVGFSAGNSNFFVRNCRSYAQGEAGVLMGANSSSATFKNVEVSGTFFTECTTWSGQPSIHCNHIHIHCVQPAPSNITGVRIFNNHFYGNMGAQQTSFCFLEGSTRGSLVYNNLFELTSGGAGNGMLFLNGAQNSLVFNNTFVGINGYAAIGISNNGPYGSYLTNNLTYNVATVVEDAVNGTLGSDYNVLYSSNASYPQWHPSAGFLSFSQWKTTKSFDLNSTTVRPTLDSSHSPTAADTVLRGAGVNLSSFFTTDKNGNPRPSTGSWTIGAFEFGGTNLPPSLPSVTLAASPATILNGQSSTLTWTSSNATNVSLSGVGGVALNGNRVVSPSVTTSYTVTATGTNGTTTATATVTVSQVTPIPTATLVASSAAITNGQSSTLSWTSGNATNVTLSGFGLVALNGSQNVAPTNTTAYTLTATGAGGTTTASATVTVSQTTPLPTVTLTALPASITGGQSSALAWTSSNATSVSISGLGSVALNGSTIVVPGATTTYTATATGPGGTQLASSTVTVTTNQVSTSLAFEAEAGILTPPFSITAGYVSQSVATDLLGGGRASYRFLITEAYEYVVLVTVDAPSDSANSFFLNIDAEPGDPLSIWDVALTLGFEPRIVGLRGTGTFAAPEFIQKRFFLGVGEHELIIIGRESNTRFDRIEIVKRPVPPNALVLVSP